jgi:hypothetical protein
MAGFRDLVAPVRPTQKHRYPRMPMAEYVATTRDDGLPSTLAAGPRPGRRRDRRDRSDVDADGRLVGGLAGVDRYAVRGHRTG